MAGAAESLVSRLERIQLESRSRGHDEGMVLEHAVLDVISGKEHAFEQAFGAAVR